MKPAAHATHWELVLPVQVEQAGSQAPQRRSWNPEHCWMRYSLELQLREQSAGGVKHRASNCVWEDSRTDSEEAPTLTHPVAILSAVGGDVHI